VPVHLLQLPLLSLQHELPTPCMESLLLHVHCNKCAAAFLAEDCSCFCPGLQCSKLQASTS
jgi:hypothetical protein